ncbi:efflux transporter outer membrane subunit [Paludibacterium yongneupense]|uniref:efflux transporter outer membrane subunit n=1 Tax=Paludibacterium yongneupense TaxID=400061 RepID=UPI000490CDF5|nr:efflux transporter outer membrane subunit [Paludibacterium yongneupense]
MIKRGLSLLPVLLVAACAVGPDYVRPASVLPAAWKATGTPAVLEDGAWWRTFDDPVLDRMIATALEYNQDLAAAAARVDEAQAALHGARASLLPRVDAGLSYDKGRSSAFTTRPGAAQVTQIDSAGAALSWEIDLWGKLRRRRESAQASLAANRYAYDGARLSLAARVGQTYFQLLALDAQSTVAAATLSSRLESLTLREARFRGGLTSALDWHQARAQADEARVAVSLLRQSIETTEHALAVLIGASPRSMMLEPLRGKALIDQDLPLVLPSGLPSELLDRRPDLAQAEQQLIAANAQIGAARAAFFPSISLTGALGTQSTALANLFTGPARTWSFGADVLAPLIDFGATASNVDVVDARQRQALAGYRYAVQNAFRETLDALTAQQAMAERELAQHDRLRAAQAALQLSRLRYDNGYSAYLEVLDAERDAFQAELDLVQARLDRLDTAINLFKALGGGWERKPEPAARLPQAMRERRPG